MFDSARSMFAGASGPGYNFPSPWLDASSQAMPTTWHSALDWCEFLWYREPTLARALQRVIAFFITELDITSSEMSDEDKVEDDDRYRWLETFEALRFREMTTEADQNFVATGNAYVALQIPISQRILACPRCHAQFPCKDVVTRREFNFNFSRYEFEATCPRCRSGSGYHGTFNRVDIYEDDPKKLVIRCFPPKEIEIQNDLWTGRCDYFWKVPEDYKQDLKRCVPITLENVHPDVLSAIRKGDPYVRFDRDFIFHMKEPVLAGIRNRGMGFPRLFTLFRDIWYVQVIRRANESLGMDYLVPIRVISPDVRPGAGGLEGGAGIDALLQMSQSSFASSMNSIIRKHRMNPTDWYVSSWPMKYQILSGDGKQFVPKDLLDQAEEMMLNSAGVPMDFYRGTIQVQAMPGALRLMEQTWAYMVQQNNQLLTWIANKIARMQSWQPVKIAYRRILFTEDFEKQMALMQLLMAGLISRETAFSPWGLDQKHETRKKLEEQRDEQEQTSRIQEEMDQSAYGQAVAQGQVAPNGQQLDPATGQPMQPGQQPGQPGMMPGMPGGQMGAGPPPTNGGPAEMESWAEAKASELLIQPESIKDSELRQLSQQDEFLHQLVKSKMDKQRDQLRLQGGEMMKQQMGAPPPGGGGQPM